MKETFRCFAVDRDAPPGACCRPHLRFQQRPRRHRHGHHLLPEGADRGLQGRLREGQPGHQARDPQQEHGRGHRLRARDCRRASGPRCSGPARRMPSRCSSATSLLEAGSDVDNPAVPAKIGNYPINDPQGFYLGQALAGYGIMYNTRYLQANKLAAPQEWDDLLKPAWFGHVAMTSPSRSGTMHLTVETILQGEGWDKGWGTDAADGRQQRADHRAQLRRAGRRQQRPVRRRPGHRLLRPRRQVLGLPGRVRLSGDDLDRAGEHRADRRRARTPPRRASSCSSR